MRKLLLPFALTLPGCWLVAGTDDFSADPGAGTSGSTTSTSSAGGGGAGGAGTGGAATLAPIASLVVGGAHACVVLTDGDLWCWGSNRNGKLGSPTATSEECLNPVVSPCRWQAARVEGLPPIGGAALGPTATCAWSTTGELFCWGEAENGLLGSPSASFDVNATTGVHCTEVPRIVSLVGVTAAAIGAVHGCALSGGAVWCWGSNTHGYLGVGDLAAHTGVVPAIAATSGFSELAISTFTDAHTCAVRATDQTAYCWGRNQGGEQGHAQPGNDLACSGIWCNPTPSPVRLANGQPFTPIAHIATMEVASCALTPGGQLYCWGDSLFSTTTLPTQTFEPISANVTGQMQQIGGVSHHACSIDANGDLYCWGRNQVGQLGLGTLSGEPIGGAGGGGTGGGGAGELQCGFGTDQGPCWRTPQKVTLPGPAKLVGVGANVTLVLLEDGRLFGFGIANRGLLGVDPQAIGLCSSAPSECTPTPTLVEVLPR